MCKWPTLFNLSRVVPGLILGVTLALLLPQHAQAKDKRIEIEIPFFAGGEGVDFFLHAGREYEKVRPDVKVNIYGDPRIADKVRVRILEGTYFEVTNAFINYWPLIYNNDILPLDEFLDQPSWDNPDITWRDSFLPGSLNQFEYEGKIYGIPLAYFVWVIWYNKAMFAEHGWEVPQTWDELFDLCEDIKKAGIAPFAFQGRYPYYANAVVDSAYYRLAGFERWRAQKYLEPGSFDNPEYIQALRLADRLATNYYQPGALGMDHTTSQFEFFRGRTAMIACGSWLKSEMLGKIPDDFELGCFNLPSPPNPVGDPTAIAVGSNCYFVMSRSRHPREAVEFLRFMTSRTMAGKFSRMTDIAAAVKGSAEGNLSEDMSDLVEIINAARTTYGTLPGEGFPEMALVINDAMQKIITPGETTPSLLASELEKIARTVRHRAENPNEIRIVHVFKPAILIVLLVGAMLYWLVATTRNLKRRKTHSEIHSTVQRMRWRNILLFIGPAALLYTVFVIVPSLRSFTWSVQRWNGLTSMAEMEFVGMLNFRRLIFESDTFWIALKNNLFLMLVVPTFVIPLALFMAACISRGIWGSRMFRIVFFFPNLLGVVAVTLLWGHLYNPAGGPINAAIVAVGQVLSLAGSLIGIENLGQALMGMQSFAWLSPTWLYWSLIPISIWGACGFNMVLYLAAMENVPETLYESATIDGASPWRQFWTITLPLIWDILAISIVFMVIGGMKAFEIIWLLTDQRPPSQSHVISTRMVQTMFEEFKVGEATAIAVLLFLMVFLGTVATLRVMRRERVELS